MISSLVQPIVDLWTAHPVGQSIGLLASAGYLLAATQRRDQHLFGIQLLGTMSFVIHYILLGAWAGAFGYMAGTARNLTAYFKWATPNLRVPISIVFAIIYGLVAIFTAYQFVEIIPPVSGLLTAVAFFNFTGIRMRAILMCAQGLFIFYALYVGSIGGCLTATSELILTSITIVRLLNHLRAPASDLVGAP